MILVINRVVFFEGFAILAHCDLFILQASSLPVHGVAIPTIDGIRNVLTHIRAHMNGEQIRVLWISLREEPVIFHI